MAAGQAVQVPAGHRGMLIGAGLVCVYSSVRRGRTMPLCLLWAGDVVGVESPFRQHETALQLRAVTNLQLLPLNPLGTASLGALQTLGQQTASKLALQADWRVAGGAFERVAQTLRLLALWALATEPLDGHRHGRLRIPLGITALADLCGLSRRHTGEALAPLHAAGWLQEVCMSPHESSGSLRRLGLPLTLLMALASSACSSLGTSLAVDLALGARVMGDALASHAPATPRH